MGIAGALSNTLTLFTASDILYSFTPSFDDVPGNYSVTVVYTATTQ